MAQQPTPYDNFAIPSESAIASYSFTDMLQGRGILTFLCGLLTDSTGELYRLSSNAYIGSKDNATSPYKHIYAKNADFVKEIDLDFDTVEFSKPLEIQGELTAQIPYNSSGGSYTYFIVKVRKWDGSSETEIASGQSQTSEGSLLSDNGYMSFPIDVPRTLIKKGEKLRITLEAWFKSTNISRHLEIYYDIQNLAIASDMASDDREAGYTLMRFDVPFKINL